jgi:hypothetical protein
MPNDIEHRLGALHAFDHVPSLPDPAELRHIGTTRVRRRRAGFAVSGVVGLVIAVGAVGIGPVHLSDRHAITPATSNLKAVRSAPAIESGVVSWDGKPVAGAIVSATLLPNDATLIKIPDGQPIPTFSVGATTTSANGHYQLLLDPASVPAKFTDLTQVTMDVSVSYAGQRGAWRVSAIWCDWDGAQANWCYQGEYPTLRFNLGANPEVSGGSTLLGQAWTPLPLTTG